MAGKFFSLILIGFSIPFLMKAFNSAMFALQPNTMGGTGRAIVFGIIGIIPLVIGVRHLIVSND